MASHLRITEAELLDALAVAARGNAPENARTVPELAEETGMHQNRIRKALHAFKLAGRLLVHPIYREALDGRRAKTTGYTIAPAPKSRTKRPR